MDWFSVAAYRIARIAADEAIGGGMAPLTPVVALPQVTAPPLLFQFGLSTM